MASGKKAEVQMIAHKVTNILPMNRNHGDGICAGKNKGYLITGRVKIASMILNMMEQKIMPCKAVQYHGVDSYLEGSSKSSNKNNDTE